MLLYFVLFFTLFRFGLLWFVSFYFVLCCFVFVLHAPVLPHGHDYVHALNHVHAHAHALTHVLTHATTLTDALPNVLTHVHVLTHDLAHCLTLTLTHVGHVPAHINCVLTHALAHAHMSNMMCAIVALGCVGSVGGGRGVY